MRKLIVAMALLCAGLAFASGQPPQPVGQGVAHTQQTAANTKTEDHPATYQERGTENAPLVIRPDASTAQQSRDEASQDRDAHKKDADLSWRIGFWTIIILVIQAIVFGVQALQLRRTVGEMETATAATNTIASTLSSNARAHLRAYVYFNGCRYISHPDLNGHIFWRVRPSWINAGSTPTRHMRVSTYYELRDDDLPVDFAFMPDDSPPVPSVLAPGISIESSPRDYYGEDLVAVQEGRKKTLCMGCRSL